MKGANIISLRPTWHVFLSCGYRKYRGYPRNFRCNRYTQSKSEEKSKSDTTLYNISGDVKDRVEIEDIKETYHKLEE